MLITSPHVVSVCPRYVVGDGDPVRHLVYSLHDWGPVTGAQGRRDT